MNDRDAVVRLNTIFDRVGAILLEAAVSDSDGRPWRRGYLDVRGAQTGDCRLEKWRLELSTGEVLSELDVARGIATLLTDAYDLRDEEFADKKWYGLLISVYPDGQCKVEFDYDPDCVSKGFFDS